MAPQGNIDPATSALVEFVPIPVVDWEWCGTFGGAEKTVGPTADLQTVFAPEAALVSGTGPTPLDKVEQPDWRRGSGEGAVFDFSRLTQAGWNDRGVCYARTTVHRTAAGSACLALRVDYFAKVWVNGALVRTVAEGHGHPNTPILIPVELKAGDNTILVKIHSGSRGNRFSLFIEKGKT